MLRDRARSALILVPALLVVAWLGGPWITAVIGLAVVLGAREAFRLLEAAGHPTLPMLGTAVALVIALADSIPAMPSGSGLLLAGVGLVLIGTAALARHDPREGLATFATTVFGALYVGMLGFIPRLAATGPGLAAGAPLAFLGSERGWLLVLIGAVWSFDTGAYFTGRRFGRHPFMAHISPSKTLEGVIGGAVAATAWTTLAIVGLGWSPLLGALLGPVIAAAAQAGDLAESMLKRAAGAKDAGTLIPGHGGMLDRIDSFLFAAPAAMLYVLVAFR